MRWSGYRIQGAYSRGTETDRKHGYGEACKAESDIVLSHPVPTMGKGKGGTWAVEP